MFGVDIVNEARKENPQWFDSEWTKEVYDLVQESYQAEIAIIDWIFEQGEIDAVSKATIVEYIKSRYNVGLTSAGFTAPFVVNPDLLKDTEFFDLQLSTTTHVDFFHKRSSNYTKKTMAFDADSLF
jgi:ribonucleoside-diphosphate reductase beta chain